jgi:CheY-like chemotaxis protein
MAKKILLVEDDVDVVSVYKAILEKAGYSVISAPNKKDGMELAKNENPDLIVLDVMMTTHYEGFEMKQELDKLAALKDVPVLFQTSIELVTTSDGQKESIQAMAREFRKDPQFKDLQVLLIKNLANGLNGVDYMDENGNPVYFEVDGFLRKPVTADQLLPEVQKMLG